jgi:hypothetical protein
MLRNFFVRDYLGLGGLACRTCRLLLLQALLPRDISE